MSRTEVFQNSNRAIKYLEDDSLKELSERVRERLKCMTDEEFAGLEIVAAE
ncbi:transposon-transfer assisting family protein [Anaerocolumna jejuensis]|uniref:transposon-transfer assisting family protein n=1 Tax=Anaerocolumna jejuensis TaxID=259063 RepID=UPI003F7C15DE